MNKKIIKFEDTEIEEYILHQNENSILINNIDINKIILSNKLPFGKQGFKYFIGYKDFEKIGLLYILLHKWLYIREILMKIDGFIF